MLPPYPELVTKLTNVKVNHPGQRSPEAYVRHVLQLDVKDRRYARDEYGTKCNFFVHDVLHVMGYPVPYMRAKQYIQTWRNGHEPLVKMVIEDAITNANLGCPAVFGLSNATDTWHVGVILPQVYPDNVEDVMVANVGATNFYGRQLKYAVGRDGAHHVEFFGAP